VSSTGWWNVGCTVFEVDHLVVEHHSAVWLWDGRITWHPIVSQSLGRGFYELELEHPKWFCLADGWRVWEPPATTMVADTHRQLACSAYASPSTTRWVRNYNGGPTYVGASQKLASQSGIWTLSLQRWMWLLVLGRPVWCWK
jgi:hypothetical protein